MSDSGDCGKYKWTPDSTSLLVSVWTDKQVQKQLEYTTKPQLIWDSVARYMQKKGYNVTGKQCRSRMKQVLVCYREAKKAGTRAGVEQYYESIDKVLQDKRLLQTNINGVDTVDIGLNVKSPPKDVKTNKNLQMRHQYRDPVQTFLRSNVISPTWENAGEDEYPDSPESNETVLAQPYRPFSPVRDVGTNTVHQLTPTVRKSMRQNAVPTKEVFVQQQYRQSSLPNNRYSEIPFQNTVQNVQNQIIQENMQQNQVLLEQNRLQAHNQLLQQNMLHLNPNLPQNVLHNTNHVLQSQLQQNVPRIRNDMVSNVTNQNLILPNIRRTQNEFQQGPAAYKQAMPQEPRKVLFRQNLAATHKQYQERTPIQNLNAQNFNPEMNLIGDPTPDYLADVLPNLNEAFCESSKNEKSQILNETFNQVHPTYHPGFLPTLDATSLTTNATYNDDTLSIEFLQESPTPSESLDNKLKDFATNTESAPDAPFRKKKAQKLEQLMMSAISSQNDVVNKILTAQNDMVTKFLDVDRDRQNRLENRLDHLLNVVHASVLNKSSDKESEIPPPPPVPRMTRLAPPPQPGSVPPKLDLVPPKPCRIPCTLANPKVELVNQNPVLTRPGCVSPIMSPNQRVGAIWSKLGPAPNSPFIRAQMQLGFLPQQNMESRTHSSAERRIAKEIGLFMDIKTLISETITFLEMERRLNEKIENTGYQMYLKQDLATRKNSFNQRESNAAIILSSTFLDTEREMEEMIENTRRLRIKSQMMQNNNGCNGPRFDEVIVPRIQSNIHDVAVTGSGEGFERMRQMNIDHRYHNEPMDSSTPAKIPMGRPNDPDAENRYKLKRESERHVNFNDNPSENTKQSIQQLAQLVMNSARWRDTAKQSQLPKNVQNSDIPSTKAFGNDINSCGPFNSNIRDNNNKLSSLNHDRYSSGVQVNAYSNRGQTSREDPRMSYNRPQSMPHPEIGFTHNMKLINDDASVVRFGTQMGFVDNNGPLNSKSQSSYVPNVNKDQYLDQKQFQHAYSQNYMRNDGNLRKIQPFMTSNGQMVMAQTENMIHQYLHGNLPSKGKENKETDSDNDEEFLDTTASMPPSLSRRASLASTGTMASGTSSKSAKAVAVQCIIS